MFIHKPVMVKQVLDCLDIKSSDIVVDCTIGEGGHSSYFIDIVERGAVLGIEQDEEILKRAVRRFQGYHDKFIPVKGNFSNIKGIVKETIRRKVDKIFFDLGISMFHFKESGRGFSFSKSEPLDMRLDISRSPNAMDVVNQFDKRKLAEIIWAYGEEKFSNRIATFIVKEREKKPITMSTQLADIVKRAIPKKFWPRNIHPATKTFQAIRVFVNDEIEILERALRDGIDVLKQGGRICVISFHSLEDRIVKSVFRELARGCTCPSDFPVCVCGGKKLVRVITKKPLVPVSEEVEANPASRGARLRCALKARESSSDSLEKKMKVTA